MSLVLDVFLALILHDVVKWMFADTRSKEQKNKDMIEKDG